MSLFNITIHIHADLEQVEKKLGHILNHTHEIMSKITDIEAKVDELQASLDAEQTQIQAAIDALNVTVQELRDQILAGAPDNDALDRIATKLDGIKTDLEGTIADNPPLDA